MWGRPYLACLRTIWVKLDLLRSKFTSCVHIIAQIDPAKGTLTQELSPTPINGSTRSYIKSRERKREQEHTLDHELSVLAPSCPTELSAQILLVPSIPSFSCRPKPLVNRVVLRSRGLVKWLFCVEQITLFSKLLNMFFIYYSFFETGPWCITHTVLELTM